MTNESSVKEPVAREQQREQQKVSPMSAAARNTAASGSAVSGEIHHFLTDIEDLIKEATSLTGDELNQVKAKLSARVAEAKESVEELGGEIADHARKGVKVTNEYVHHQPWMAVGAGAAAGLLLGLVLARRG